MIVLMRLVSRAHRMDVFSISLSVFTFSTKGNEMLSYCSAHVHRYRDIQLHQNAVFTQPGLKDVSEYLHVFVCLTAFQTLCLLVSVGRGSASLNVPFCNQADRLEAVHVIQIKWLKLPLPQPLASPPLLSLCISLFVLSLNGQQSN